MERKRLKITNGRNGRWHKCGEGRMLTLLADISPSETAGNERDGVKDIQGGLGVCREHIQ